MTRATVNAMLGVVLLLVLGMGLPNGGEPGAQTVGGPSFARPLDLRYLPDYGVLWAAAPERAAADADSSWSLWHVDVPGRQVQRIGYVDQGMYDVVDADGSYLAAWFDHGRLRLWSSASERPRTVTHPARDKAIRTPPSWAPDGSAVAWVTTEQTSGEGILRVYQPAGDCVDDITIPAGVAPPEDTRPAWGRDARIIALVRRWGPSFDVHSQLLVWRRDDRAWRAWARPLPHDATIEDMGPQDEQERVLASHTYYTVPGMPVVLASAGGPGGLKILYVDTLTFHGQREDLPAEIPMGSLFIASSLSAFAQQLDRGVYVGDMTDGRRAIFQEPVEPKTSDYRDVRLPSDAPVEQRAGVAPGGHGFVLAGEPGSWRVLSVDLSRKRVRRLVELR